MAVSKLCKAYFRLYLHVFHPIWVFAARGGGGGARKGLVHNLLMQIFTLDSSKMEVFETYLFHIVITLNYRPSYVKQFLGRIYMFWTLFGYWVGGGGVSQGIGTQPAYAAFHPGQLKNGSFRNLFISYCHHLKLPSKLCKAYFRPYLHVLDPIWVLGWGGGSPKGLVHNLLMQFFTLDSSKMEVFETYFFDIVIT